MILSGHKTQSSTRTRTSTYVLRTVRLNYTAESTPDIQMYNMFSTAVWPRVPTVCGPVATLAASSMIDHNNAFIIPIPTRPPSIPISTQLYLAGARSITLLELQQWSSWGVISRRHHCSQSAMCGCKVAGIKNQTNQQTHTTCRSKLHSSRSLPSFSFLCTHTAPLAISDPTFSPFFL
jgi:hypothetical protein